MGQGFDPRLPGASDEASGAEALRPTLPDDAMAGENGECATHGCERKVASSRARYCRQCFIVRARLASLRRSSFGGGGGGNRVARGLSGNAGNKITGPTKVSAGSRSGVKRSAKHALVVQKSRFGQNLGRRENLGNPWLTNEPSGLGVLCPEQGYWPVVRPRSVGGLFRTFGRHVRGPC